MQNIEVKVEFSMLETAHKNREIIKAFLNGSEIQFKHTGYADDSFEDYNYTEQTANNGKFSPWYCASAYEWRIKPVIKKEKRKVWVNVYKAAPGNADVFHPSKTEADSCASLARIACVEIEYEFEYEIEVES